MLWTATPTRSSPSAHRQNRPGHGQRRQGVPVRQQTPDTATGDGCCRRLACLPCSEHQLRRSPTGLCRPARKSSSSAKRCAARAGASCCCRHRPVADLGCSGHDPRAQTRPARCGGRRHRLRDEKARPRLCAPRHFTSPAFLQEHLPISWPTAHQLGIDITKEPVPYDPTATHLRRCADRPSRPILTFAGPVCRG